MRTHQKKYMQLAIVGIRGLPNTYGGFETLAENLVHHLSKDLDITVYCSSKDMESRMDTFDGARLKYIPVTSHGAFGIIYDSIALVRAVLKNDKVLFLGFGGGFVVPFLWRYKSKLILNIGGLDWQRSKWSGFAQKIIRKAEALLMKNCGTLISDNVGIQQYIQQQYGRSSTLIAYGGDQAVPQEILPEHLTIYPFLSSPYAFAVCRIQHDNNINMILDAFVENPVIPLVLVGNWADSEYGIKTKSDYSAEQNLILLDAIYDRKLLDVLRSNCTFYIHGHSAGGTNPSLAEAMYLGLPVFAFASGYNEHTTNHQALYFGNLEELKKLIRAYSSVDLEKMGNSLREIAVKAYRWSTIADQYKQLILD